MTLLSDENLMAYADKQLSEELKQKIQSELQQSPEAQQRLRLFEQSVSALRAFDEITEEPLPQELLALFNNGDKTPINDIDRQSATLDERNWGAPWMAMAASLVFAVGLGFGFLGGQEWRSQSSGGILQVAVPQALETQIRGVPASFQDGQAEYEILPLATFANAAGNHCRSFELVELPNNVSQGLACRDVNKQWSIKLLVPAGSSLPATTETGTGYQTASGSQTLLENTKAQLGLAAPLSLDDEKRLLKNAWKN